MDIKIKSYNKKLEYSYSLGVFPTLELIENKKDKLIKVIVMNKGLENEGVKKAIDICNRENIRVEINDKLINKISKKENNYIVGVFKKYKMNIEGGNHIVLVNPGDMGNIGTIIRSSLGFGVENIAIIEPAVDIYNPKVIRGSMGAIFKVRVEYFKTFEEYRSKFEENELFPFILDAKYKLKEVQRNREKNYSLIFGNESSGLEEGFFSNIGKSVKIEQTSQVDSLNLSIAVAIGLYEFSK